MKVYFVRLGKKWEGYSDKDEVIKVLEVKANSKRDAHNIAEETTGLRAIGSYVYEGLTDSEINKLRNGALSV